MRFKNGELYATPQALAHALSLLTNSNYNQLLYDFANAEPGESVHPLIKGISLFKLDRENRWGLRGDSNQLAAMEMIRAAECLRLAANHFRNSLAVQGMEPAKTQTMIGTMYRCLYQET